MNKRIFSFIVLLFCFSFSAFANMKSPYQEEVFELAARYEKAYFKQFPESGTYWGRTDVALDAFMDHSLEGVRAWEEIEDDFLNALKRLPENELQGSALITYRLLKQSIESHQATRVCKNELWNVNPLWGWHNMLSVVAEKQPIGTPLNRQLALKRWHTVPKIVDDEIHNLQLGLQQGYTAPKPVVERVLKQLTLILHTPIEKSPFYDFAARDTDPDFQKQMAQIIRDEINPAIQRYADFLEKEYLPKARTTIGVSALPGKAACYQANLLKEMTLAISPEEIYQFGLAHMEQLTKEVADIGRREFGETNMTTVFRLAKQDPKNTFQSEAQILAYNEQALQRAYDKASAWFDLVPKAKATLKPYPLHRAQTGAAGEYHPPSDDGERPGIFYAEHARFTFQMRF